MCLVEIENFKVLANYYPLKTIWYRVNLIRLNYMFWSIISSKPKGSKRLWACSSSISMEWCYGVPHYLSSHLIPKLFCVTPYWKWKQICPITYKVDILLTHCQSVNSTECSVKSRWDLQPKCSKIEGSYRFRSVNWVNITPQYFDIVCTITTRLRSYRKVMFSVVWVCLYTGGLMWPLPMMH